MVDFTPLTRIPLGFSICLTDSPPLWTSSSPYFSILAQNDIMKDIVRCLADIQNTVSNFPLDLQACGAIHKFFIKIKMNLLSASLKPVIHLSRVSSHLSDNYFSHALALSLCFLEPSFCHLHPCIILLICTLPRLSHLSPWLWPPLIW